MTPFAFKTACILLGMLSISFWHVSGSISVHSFATLSHKSCTPLGGMSYCWSLALRCCQRCSMGFRSGDWAGHFMGMMLLSENHLSAFFEVCFGSLSCWKYHLSLAISKLSILSSPPPPKHQVIPPSMVDSWCGGPV